jgi:hypothetical protein
MQRHARREGGKAAALATVRSASIAPDPLEGGIGPPGRDLEGDILYGAKAIARYIFGDDSNRSRRRVFNLWARLFPDRREQALTLSYRFRRRK